MSSERASDPLSGGLIGPVLAAVRGEPGISGLLGGRGVGGVDDLGGGVGGAGDLGGGAGGVALLGLAGGCGEDFDLESFVWADSCFSGKLLRGGGRGGRSLFSESPLLLLLLITGIPELVSIEIF